MPSRTVANTAALLIPPNKLRVSVIFQNEDTTLDCFIKKESGDALTVSTTDHDHRLSAGGSISLNYNTDGKEAIQERWTIVSVSGTPRISFFETEDKKR